MIKIFICAACLYHCPAFGEFSWRFEHRRPKCVCAPSCNVFMTMLTALCLNKAPLLFKLNHNSIQHASVTLVEYLEAYVLHHRSCTWQAPPLSIVCVLFLHIFVYIYYVYCRIYAAAVKLYRAYFVAL